MSEIISTADVGRACAALADPTRRLVLLALIEHPIICNTATKMRERAELNISRQAIYKHLFVLEAAQLITSTRARENSQNRRERQYTVNGERFRQLAEWLVALARTIDTTGVRL